jgi:hypothetical protein
MSDRIVFNIDLIRFIYFQKPIVYLSIFIHSSWTTSKNPICHISTHNTGPHHSHLTKRIIKIPYRIPLRINLIMRIPIPHKLIPIPRPIRNIIVLIPNLPHHLKIMQPTPRPNRRNRPVCLPVLKPTAARRTPRQSLHKLVRVVVHLLYTFLLRVEGLDVFALELADHLEHIPRMPLEDREDRPVRCGPVWPNYSVRLLIIIKTNE